MLRNKQEMPTESNSTQFKQKIVRLNKDDGSQVYPQTITDAIGDVKSNKKLSDVLDEFRASISGNTESIQNFMDGSGITDEEIDSIFE